MFKTSWRFFIRAVLQNRAYTLLNVIGLALGLAVTLLVLVYLKSELTYDQHHPESENIYRLTSHFYLENEQHHFAQSGIGLAPLMQEESDAIETYARIGSAGKNVLLKYKNEAYYEDEIFYADSSYFKLFPAQFVQGDPRTALKGSNNMVLTESLAKRIFGSENPIGKVLRTNNNRLVVSAVIKDLPRNNHVQFKAILPAFTEKTPREEIIRTLWMASTFTYVKMVDGTGERELQQAFQSVHDKYMSSIAKAIESDYDIIPEALSTIHYNSKSEFDLPRGKHAYLYVFAGVGLLILALAMINYMNLSSARASARAKEIGMRKVLGSTTRDLVWQLIFESVFLSVFSLFLAVILVELLLQSGWLNGLLDGPTNLNVINEPFLIYGGFITAVIVGILSGIYPAFYLSRINTTSALKGSFRTEHRSKRIRSFLVGFQFTISVSVVVLALLMTRQMEFMGDRYLGFNKEDVLLVPVQDTSLRRVVPDMLQEIRKEPNVLAASMAKSIPGSNFGKMLMMARTPKHENITREAIDYIHVGQGYFSTMEMKFVKGGPFQTELHSDTSETAVVNQRLVDYYGWSDPIGQVLEWGLNDDGRPSNTIQIVGVVEDFNVASLHKGVDPLVMFLGVDGLGTMHIRVDSENLKIAVSQIEKVWNTYKTGRPFEFSFLDEDLEALYQEDNRQAQLISMLTLITIIISTVGLIGLSSYTAQQRYKEIGVRKVLGATVLEILNLLFKDVVGLVGVAVLISIPLSWLVYKIWVSGFAYFAPVDWYLFLATGVVASLFAYGVVSLHSLSSARTNPIKSLKHE